MANDSGGGGGGLGSNPKPPGRPGRERLQRVRRNGWVWEWDGPRGWVKIREVTVADLKEIPHAGKALDRNGGGGSSGWDDPPADGGDGDGGAGGAGGGDGHGDNGDGGGADTKPQNVRQKIRELYPQFAVYLSVPEVRRVLEKAAKEGWSPERLKGAIQKTKWWDRTTQATRNWLEFTETAGDREVKLTIARKAQELREFAIREFGVREIDIEEMKKIAERGLRLGWTDAMFASAIRQHNDFIDRSESEQQFVEDMVYNREDLRQRIGLKKSELRAMADRMGVNLDGKTLRRMAADALKFEMSNEQIIKQLADKADFSSEKDLQGDSAKVFRDMRQLAGDYMVPVAHGTLAKWAKRILSGGETIDSYIQFIQTMAKSKFPTLTNVIDRGISVNEFAEPYRQTIADLLEVSPDAVDFGKAKFGKVLSGARLKDGTPAPMSVADAEDYVRGLDDWQYTKQAEEHYRTMAERVGQMFGFSAGA